MSQPLEDLPTAPSRRKMPKQKRGTSEQIVGTPPEFMEAVEREFGPLAWDLAALATNKKAEWYLGPDREIEYFRDSLSFHWPSLTPSAARNWLNPPFAKIKPWAKKCAQHAQEDRFQTLMLVPGSIGANWYEEWVFPYADVYSVGRMKFIGSKDQYPKDLVLCHYWKLGGYKLKRWRWER